ncbi:MAG: hypothetical protein RIR51_2182, partial [Bacteroidota bacterium]
MHREEKKESKEKLKLTFEKVIIIMIKINFIFLGFWGFG